MHLFQLQCIDKWIKVPMDCLCFIIRQLPFINIYLIAVIFIPITTRAFILSRAANITQVG